MNRNQRSTKVVFDYNRRKNRTFRLMLEISLLSPQDLTFPHGLLSGQANGGGNSDYCVVEDSIKGDIILRAKISSLPPSP